MAIGAVQDSEHIGTHEETCASRRKRDEGDVSEADVYSFNIDVLEDDECQPLVNIIIGVILSQPVLGRFVTAKDIGLEHLKDFATKRHDTN